MYTNIKRVHEYGKVTLLDESKKSVTGCDTAQTIQLSDGSTKTVLDFTKGEFDRAQNEPEIIICTEMPEGVLVDRG